MSSSSIGMATVSATTLALMKGRKWDLFVLDISFIGWELLGTLPIIGYLVRFFTMPYISMTKALAKEVSADGVLVNCVSPGSVSRSTDPDYTATTPSELSCMGRTGSHMENANLICFLASEDASYISGQNIQIDGCRKKQ